MTKLLMFEVDVKKRDGKEGREGKEEDQLRFGVLIPPKNVEHNSIIILGSV